MIGFVHPHPKHHVQFKSISHRSRIWRPLTGPYQDNTLAVCDARTVSTNDLEPADILFPHYCDEGYEMKYNFNHRWFYKRRMQADDVILFKHYDSDNTEATCELKKKTDYSS